MFFSMAAFVFQLVVSLLFFLSFFDEGVLDASRFIFVHWACVCRVCSSCAVRWPLASSLPGAALGYFIVLGKGGAEIKT